MSIIIWYFLVLYSKFSRIELFQCQTFSFLNLRTYYARSERSERSVQLLAFKCENFVYSRTKNSSMCPFRGRSFTYGEKKHHFLMYPF